jgi:hypothetical protein
MMFAEETRIYGIAMPTAAFEVCILLWTQLPD